MIASTRTLVRCLVLAVLGSTLACGPDNAASEGSHAAPTPESATRAGQPLETTPDLERGFDLDSALLVLEVRAALLKHVGIDSLDFGVEADDGMVTLTGETRDKASKKLAGEATLAVDGVSGVENRLVAAQLSEGSGTPVARAVESAENEIADALLETRVKAALVRELGEVGFSIEVEAADGSVSLRGDVPDDERREVALRIASEVRGVDKVHDLLSVGS